VSSHPLDPLSADEIRAAAAILRRDKGVTERWRFASIELPSTRPASTSTATASPIGTTFPTGSPT
jgi:Cu2+-containing amine oxidase